jgi:hypothetical protein
MGRLKGAIIFGIVGGVLAILVFTIYRMFSATGSNVPATVIRTTAKSQTTSTTV